MPKTDVYELQQQDINDPEQVEVAITRDHSGLKVWINVNGKCLLRCINVQDFVISDMRLEAIV